MNTLPNMQHKTRDPCIHIIQQNSRFQIQRSGKFELEIGRVFLIAMDWRPNPAVVQQGL